MMVNSMEVDFSKENGFPSLPLGELHVWQISTDISEVKLAKYKSVLSENELEKASFFEFEKVKSSYIISQGALRLLLSKYINIPTSLVKLGRKEKGKPFSINDSGLYFNMSNSGELVVIAFSRGSEVGIDIEKIRPLPDLEKMIASNFTANEIKFINGKPAEKSNRFFRFWTIKESYLKAIGEGMRLPPSNIEFTIEKDKVKQLSVKGVFEQEDWNFEEFIIAPNYVGTLTYGGKNITIKQLRIN